MKKQTRQLITLLYTASILLFGLSAFFLKFFQSLFTYKMIQYLFYYPSWNWFLVPICILSLFISIIPISKDNYVGSLIFGFIMISAVSGLVISSGTIVANLGGNFHKFGLGFYFILLSIAMMIGAMVLIILQSNRKECARCEKAFPSKMLKKCINCDELVCPDCFDEGSSVCSKCNFKISRSGVRQENIVNVEQTVNVQSPSNSTNEMKICSYCGTKIGINASFCESCGGKQ